MTGISRTVSTVLAYAGAVPFWLLIAAPESVAGISAETIFISYGAIIGSFMAGTLWGREQIEQGTLFIIGASNVFALIAFGTVVSGLSLPALLAQLILFGLLFVADKKSLARREEQRWYLALRLRVTLIVAFAYCVMMAHSALP